jgi:anti-sigma B factor antagonist
VDPGDFSIEARQDGERYTLILRGELDMASAPELEGVLQELCEGSAQELVLDLRQLSFMDSTGLNAVLRSRSLCEEHGCDFGLIPGRRPVQRVFELTHLVDRLPFRQAEPATGAALRARGR